MGSLLLLFSCSLAVAREQGLPQDQLQLLNEAVGLIREHGLSLPAAPHRIRSDMLRAYTRSLDPYSDYLSAGEFRGFQESTSSDYFGVQMDLQEKEGRLLLYPFKGGLAAKSGIQAGDELLAVNAVPVYGKSMYVVGATIRGEEGTTVQLTLRSGRELARSLSLRRSRAHYQSVLQQRVAGGLLLEITRFTQDTAQQLEQVLQQLDPAIPVVLDLRGNQGGSLVNARRCADFFVARGRVLFCLRGRQGEKLIVADRDPLVENPVILLQDAATASAAEAFILALKSNHRARSAGTRSYGKGLAQRFLPLADGSALRLTYAEILAADGASYHGRGLEPDLELEKSLMNADFHQERAMNSLLAHVQAKDN
nr:S41 family peptidase [uncultured Desulfobulbus sp.]